jgi:hypothetical protein
MFQYALLIKDSRYQMLKMKAIQVIHSVMVDEPSFEVSRQHLAGLSLLAAMSWFPKLLFFRATPQNSFDAPYFFIISGPNRNLYRYGQVLFESTNLWASEPNVCPTNNGDLTLDMHEILRHFSVSTTNALVNLICGRDRHHKIVGQGRDVSPPASLDTLLKNVTINPRISTYLVDNGIPDPFNNHAHSLQGRSADYVAEAIFVAMIRGLWQKLPTKKRVEGYIKPISQVYNPKEVYESWSVERLRPPNRIGTILRYFSQAMKPKLEPEKAKEEWSSIYHKIFGLFSESGWIALPDNSVIAKMGYYPHWKAWMNSLSPLQQRCVYMLMTHKFCTLVAMPHLQPTKGWAVSKQGVFKIMENPKVLKCGDKAGYRD